MLPLLHHENRPLIEDICPLNDGLPPLLSIENDREDLSALRLVLEVVELRVDVLQEDLVEIELFELSTQLRDLLSAYHFYGRSETQ